MTFLRTLLQHVLALYGLASHPSPRRPAPMLIGRPRPPRSGFTSGTATG